MFVARLSVLLVASGALGEGRAAEPEALPPALLFDSPAAYPEAARADRVGGEVGLQLLVDAEGEVELARLVSSAHPLLDHAALQAATRLRFFPATVDGIPVPVWLSFTYRFEAPPPEEVPRAVLRGVVRARGTREPISGAAVGVEGAEEVTECAADGSFELELPPGEHAVWVRAPGFDRGQFRERLSAGERVGVVYGLEPAGPRRYETVVRDARSRSEVSRIGLSRDELREVPGTMGDPFRVVMLMPGVGAVASGLAYPVVRGAQPAETGYFVDGVRVPLLFHLFLGPSVVHPDFIDSIDFLGGAAPARYGRLLAGVVDAKVTRPRERLRASAYADLVNAGAFVEAPISRTGTQVGLAGRFSYSPWLLSRFTQKLQADADRKLVLEFFDYQGRVEQPLPGGVARLFAFGSSDVASTMRDDDTHSVLFHRIDLRYRPRVGEGEGELGATLGLDRLQYVAQSNGVRTSVLDIDTTSFAARASYSLELGDARLSAGADVDHRLARRDHRAASELGPERDRAAVATGTFVGGWAELSWERGGWSLVPGLRIDNYHLVGGTDHLAVEPRLGVRWALSERWSLTAGAGLFHQPPSTLLHLPVVDIASLPQGLQRAAHLTAGVRWRQPEGFELSASVYFNPLLRTVEFNPFAGPVLEGFQVEGAFRRRLTPMPEREEGSPGRAYGLELFARRHLGERWFGWIAYSVQRSERLVRFPRYDDEGLPVSSDRAYLPYALDQTHVLNAMVSCRLGRSWTVGATAHFHSGRPETGGLTSETRLPGTDGLGTPTWISVDRDRADRLPSFFRLDLRVAKRWTFDSFVLDAYLDLINVGLAQEVVAYRYDDDLAAGLVKVPEGAVVAIPVLGVKGTY